MKLALVHDWLNQIGGAEDVLEVLHSLYPASPVYTSIYDRMRMPASWQRWDIRASWMDRLPDVYRKHQRYMPIFAALWASRRIPDEYDVLLSNKSAFCIGARAGKGARNICFCLTPTRFTYDFETYRARERIPAAALPILRMLNIGLRRWERAAAQVVTKFAAISSTVKERITRCYGRDSELIYPPVDTNKFRPTETGSAGNYLLIVSRLLPYKRVDLAIEACNKLGIELVIAGSGRDSDRLKGMSGPTVHCLGRVSDGELITLLAGCKAFIFPGEEDFGIAPIQAMAAGKPVVAFGAGGALDTVIDGRTGILFHQPTAQSLAHAIQRMAEVTFAPDAIRDHAEQFSVSQFRDRILQFLK